jgi:hypothetical protein
MHLLRHGVFNSTTRLTEQSVVFQIWNWKRHERRTCEWLWCGETNVSAVSLSRISSPAHARSNAFQLLSPSFSPNVLYNASVCYCIHWHLRLNGPSGTSCLVEKELPYLSRQERGKTDPSALMIHDTATFIEMSAILLCKILGCKEVKEKFLLFSCLKILLNFVSYLLVFLFNLNFWAKCSVKVPFCPVLRTLIISTAVF